MKKQFSRIISLALVIFISAGFYPEASPARAAEPETVYLSNGNIEVVVSTENGGFIIQTRDGDVFNKADDNKDLLFHNGEYDTSFTSFEVTEGNTVKEYIFGGNYSFLGLGENNLEVTRESDGIVSTWSVDGLTFTQIIQPVWNEGANEHGTVAIYYEVENGKETPVDVRARVLLDTALGSQDYAFYELALDGGGFERIESECVIGGGDIPANFFGYDSYGNPSITAYTVNDTSVEGKAPYQVVFAHWNNLASTVFTFDPDPDLTFTNKYNKTYLTADSAYALYYDLGTIPADNTGVESFLTYYGVYSNVNVSSGDRFSVNITSPSSLELNDDKTMYIGSDGEEDGIFEVTTNITNIIQDGASNCDEVAVSVQVDEGLDPLNDMGVPAGASYDAPYRVSIDNFNVGEVKQLTWQFASEVFSAPGYRKITFRVYNMPESANNLLLLENLAGSASTDAVDVFGCHIINISSGIDKMDERLMDAIDHAEEMGAIVISAVGNSNINAPERVFYPAAFETVVGVGSVNREGEVSAFSQRNSSVMVTSQGENVEVLSLDIRKPYKTVNGTSYAAARVTAFAALVLINHPDTTPDEFRDLLIN